MPSSLIVLGVSMLITIFVAVDYALYLKRRKGRANEEKENSPQS